MNKIKISKKAERVKYTFADNTDFKVPATNISKTELLKIIKKMSNMNNWGNLYGYRITDDAGNEYEITTTKKGKPNGFVMMY